MKEKRMYGLFEKQNGKWVRLFPEMQYVKSVAIRIFQDALLNSAYLGQEVSLRVVKFNL